MFGLALCDRGAEFANAKRIECTRNGAKRLSLFYADPQQSQQKARAERCHEELRRILPKGRTDFDALTEADMARAMSHVNSYLRGSMDWTSPAEMARVLLGPDVLDAYGVEVIDPKQVNLTPSLVPHAVTQL